MRISQTFAAVLILGAALTASPLISIQSQQQLDSIIAVSIKENKLLLVDFSADWCGWCKKLEKPISKVLSQKNDSVIGVTIDVDTYKDQALSVCRSSGSLFWNDYSKGEGGIPHCLLIRDGVTIGTINGYMDLEPLQNKIEGALSIQPDSTTREIQKMLTSLSDSAYLAFIDPSRSNEIESNSIIDTATVTFPAIARLQKPLDYLARPKVPSPKGNQFTLWFCSKPQGLAYQGYRWKDIYNSADQNESSLFADSSIEGYQFDLDSGVVMEIGTGKSYSAQIVVDSLTSDSSRILWLKLSAPWTPSQLFAFDFSLQTFRKLLVNSMEYNELTILDKESAASHKRDLQLSKAAFSLLTTDPDYLYHHFSLVDSLLEKYPDHDMPKMMKGLLEYLYGKNDTAMMLFNASLQVNPRNYYALFYRAKTALIIGDTTAGLMDLQRVSEILSPAVITPNEVQIRARSEHDPVLQVYMDTKLAQGAVFKECNEYDQAIAAYTAVIKVADINGPNRMRIAEALSDRANCYRNLRQLEQAITEYHVALKYDPENATTFNRLGYAYLMEREMGKAANCFNQSLQLESGNYAALYLGHVELISGNIREAIQIYAHAIKMLQKQGYDSRTAKEMLEDEFSFLSFLGIDITNTETIMKEFMK